MPESSSTNELFSKFVEDFIGTHLNQLAYVPKQGKFETEYFRDVDYEIVDGLGNIRVKQNYFAYNGLLKVLNIRKPKPRLRAFVDHLDPDVPHMNFQLSDLNRVMIYKQWSDNEDFFGEATDADKQLFLGYFGIRA